MHTVQKKDCFISLHLSCCCILSFQKSSISHTERMGFRIKNHSNSAKSTRNPHMSEICYHFDIRTRPSGFREMFIYYLFLANTLSLWYPYSYGVLHSKSHSNWYPNISGETRFLYFFLALSFY